MTTHQDTGKHRTNTHDQFYTSDAVAKQCVQWIITAVSCEIISRTLTRGMRTHREQIVGHETLQSRRQFIHIGLAVLKRSIIGDAVSITNRFLKYLTGVFGLQGCRRRRRLLCEGDFGRIHFHSAVIHAIPGTIFQFIEVVTNLNI